MTPRHFLDLDRFDTATLRRILDLGKSYKNGAKGDRPMQGKILAMIFEKHSTRTRVSFEAGFRQLGGDVIVLGANDSQLGRGETIADTARVLSRYVDAIVIRTNKHDKLTEMAKHATVPVVNGLTDDTHPCQVLADVMTYEEHRGSLCGKTVAWCGDGNNVAATWIQAAAHFGCAIRLGCPDSLRPDAGIVAWARAKGASVEIKADPAWAVKGADLVITDTWVSMGCQDQNRRERLESYRIDEAAMASAAPDALFMHCLPAHRNEEVTDAVIDGPQSVVWDEAENRLHVQKGILSWCLL